MNINFNKIIQGFIDFDKLSTELNCGPSKLSYHIKSVDIFKEKYPEEYKKYLEKIKSIDQLCYDEDFENCTRLIYDDEEVNLDFVNKLLSFGGNTVEDISFDSMEELINQYGQLWYKDIISKNSFGGNEDYFKTVARNIEESDEWIYCYGYALFDNGTWKATNWFVNKVSGCLFDESPVTKVAYFGIVYNDSIDYLVTGIDKMT